MAISGINQTTYSPVALERAAERVQPQAAKQAESQAQAVAAPAAKADAALSAAAPEGVDPALWSVLTTEERAYFTRVRSMGPLTYGPAQTPARPAQRGGRIDVTV